MPTEWPEVRLGDLIEIKHGWPFKSEFFSEDLTGKPIVINIGNFQYTGGFRFDSTALKEYRDTYPEGYELTPGDVLLVMTCQTSGGEILGIPGRVPADGRTYLHNQRMGKVVIKHPSDVDIGFLYWLFLWKDFNRELATSASGTKILHTSPTRIEAFRLNLPPLQTQRRIARILGALDDEIELNRKMNETLAQMARAIFKSWFVDFEPFRDKGMVDSPLGEVPNGWLVGDLESLCTQIVRGVTPKYAKGSGRLVINQRANRGSSLDCAEFKEIDPTLVVPDAQKAHRYDVLVNSLGEGTLGRIHLFQGEDRVFAVDQHMTICRPKSRALACYIYNTLAGPDGQRRIESLKTGSTGMTMLNISRLRSMEVVIPPDAALTRFGIRVLPLYERVAADQTQEGILAAIRDALLPKLMSGEVEVR